MDHDKATRGGPAELESGIFNQDRDVASERDRPDQSGMEQPEAITESEVETVEERSRLPAPLIYEIVRFTAGNLRKLARLWAIVFAANLTGTAVAAVFCTLPPVLPPELRDVMIDISRQILQPSWIESFFRAISAGFLIAVMVWLIASAEAAAFHVITLMTSRAQTRRGAR
jgi:hypothetical protein